MPTKINLGKGNLRGFDRRRVTLTHVNGSHVGENTYVDVDGVTVAELHAATTKGDTEFPYIISVRTPTGLREVGKSFNLKRGILRALKHAGFIDSRQQENIQE